MSAENKAILRRFFEDLFNTGNLAVADEIVATDYLNHNAAPGETPGREGLKQFVAAVRTAFPDLHFTVEDQIAEGDKVVTRFTGRGTHRGEFMGIPPTGKAFAISGIGLYRLADGKIVEDRVQEDTLGMLQQLGAIPSPG